jgi:hypothetical protein
MIYQTLQDGTKARPARRVKIINLGLEPAEAIGMGLPAEPVELKKKAVPVADYVDDEWRQWLQTHRVELNAMDSPTFLEWLDGKLEPYTGKLIPPAPVLVDHLTGTITTLIRQRLTDKAIQAAKVEERTAAEVAARQAAIGRAGKRLAATVRRTLDVKPASRWSTPVEDMAAKLATGAAGGR